jgi:hypothetical protein
VFQHRGPQIRAGHVAADGVRQTLFSDRKFHPSLSRPVAERTADSMNRDSGEPAKQHAHHHRAERPHRPTGNIPRALRPDPERTLVASDRMARIEVRMPFAMAGPKQPRARPCSRWKRSPTTFRLIAELRPPPVTSTAYAFRCPAANQKPRETRDAESFYHQEERRVQTAAQRGIYKPRRGLNDISVLSKPCCGRSLNRDDAVILRMSD